MNLEECRTEKYIKSSSSIRIDLCEDYMRKRTKHRNKVIFHSNRRVERLVDMNRLGQHLEDL